MGPAHPLAEIARQPAVEKITASGGVLCCRGGAALFPGGNIALASDFVSTISLASNERRTPKFICPGASTRGGAQT